MVLQADELKTATSGPRLESGTTLSGDDRVMFIGSYQMSICPAIIAVDYDGSNYIAMEGGRKAGSSGAVNRVEVFPRDLNNEVGVQIIAEAGLVMLYTSDGSGACVGDLSNGNLYRVISRRNLNIVSSTTGTTDANGYLTVPHNSGFTPHFVGVTVQAPAGGQAKMPLNPVIDQVGSTTFRARFFCHDGSGAYANSPVTFRYQCARSD